MSEEPIHHPHDKLFKAEFSDPVSAAAFLRWEISPMVSERISWEKLRLEPGTFIDSQFRQSESDLLFSAPLADKTCLIYLLFEHQTTQSPNQALRLLSYKVRIWQKYQQEHPGQKLPVIQAIVLAQNDRNWPISPQFASLMDLPAELISNLQPLIPDFRFHLIQLANLPWAAIRGTPSGILTLRIMKAERIGQLLGDEVWDEPLFDQATQNTIDRLLTYIYHGEIDKTAFERKIIAIHSPRLKNQAMSLAQQLRQEGRQEGRQQTLVKILKRRLGEVPDGLIDAINAIHDTALLDDLVDASLEVSTIEAFAERL